VVEPNEAEAGVAVAAADVAVEMGVVAVTVRAGEADLCHHTHLKHTRAHTSTHAMRANTHTHKHPHTHTSPYIQGRRGMTGLCPNSPNLQPWLSPEPPFPAT